MFISGQGSQLHTVVICIAIWNFDKEGEHYLPLSVGDLVCVLEELAGTDVIYHIYSAILIHFLFRLV